MSPDLGTRPRCTLSASGNVVETRSPAWEEGTVENVVGVPVRLFPMCFRPPPRPRPVNGSEDVVTGVGGDGREWGGRGEWLHLPARRPELQE